MFRQHIKLGRVQHLQAIQHFLIQATCQRFHLATLQIIFRFLLHWLSWFMIEHLFSIIPFVLAFLQAVLNQLWFVFFFASLGETFQAICSRYVRNLIQVVSMFTQWTLFFDCFNCCNSLILYITILFSALKIQLKSFLSSSVFDWWIPYHVVSMILFWCLSLIMQSLFCVDSNFTWIVLQIGLSHSAFLQVKGHFQAIAMHLESLNSDRMNSSFSLIQGPKVRHIHINSIFTFNQLLNWQNLLVWNMQVHSVRMFESVIDFELWISELFNMRQQSLKQVLNQESEIRLLFIIHFESEWCTILMKAYSFCTSLSFVSRMSVLWINLELHLWWYCSRLSFLNYLANIFNFLQLNLIFSESLDEHLNCIHKACSMYSSLLHNQIAINLQDFSYCFKKKTLFEFTKFLKRISWLFLRITFSFLWYKFHCWYYILILWMHKIFRKKASEHLLLFIFIDFEFYCWNIFNFHFDDVKTIWQHDFFW